MTAPAAAPVFRDRPTRLARLFDFVRERLDAHGRGTNAGPWVEAFQRTTGNRPGDAWCASFATAVVAIAAGGPGRSPIPATASCDVLLEDARGRGWLTSEPEAEDLGLVLKDPRDAVHVFVVERVVREPGGRVLVETVEGNTNRAGSREGVGVFVRAGREARVVTPALTFIRYPRILPP